MVQSNSNTTLPDSFAERLSWLYIQYKTHSDVISLYCLYPNANMYSPNKWRSKLHRNEGLEEVEIKDTVTKLHIQRALEAHFIFLLTTLIFHNLFGTSLNGFWKHAWCYYQLPFHAQNRHIQQNKSNLSSKFFIHSSKIGVSNNDTYLRSACSFPSTITFLSVYPPSLSCTPSVFVPYWKSTRILPGFWKAGKRG